MINAPEQKVIIADVRGKISIAGQDQRSTKNPKFRNRYVGEFTKEDLCAEKQRLEQDIDGYQPQEYPCPYNPTIGEVNCTDECRSWSDWDSRCPEDRLFEAKRNLARLNLRSQLKFPFTQPHSAALFDLLSRELILSQLYAFERRLKFNDPNWMTGISCTSLTRGTVRSWESSGFPGF